MEKNNGAVIVSISTNLKYYIVAFSIVLSGTSTSIKAEDAKAKPVDAPKPVSIMDGMKFEGLIRFRPEYRHNTDFNKTTDDQKDYAGQKVQAGVTKTFNQNVTAKILIQDTRVWGGEKGAESGANTGIENQATDVREAWIDYKSDSGKLAMQAGRQILVYGDQRLIGALEWSNTGRSFDGIRFKFETEKFKSHVWGMVLGEKDSDVGGNDTSTTTEKFKDAYFTGWYNTWKMNDHFQAEAYYMGKYQRFTQKTDPITLAPGALIMSQDRQTQRDNLHTAGARLTNRTADKGKSTTAFDWTAEYVVQRGDTGKYVNAGWDTAQVTVPIDPTLFNSTSNPCRTGFSGGGCRAYTEKQTYDTHAFAAKAGYTFDKTVRLGAEYNVGSGDPDRSDSRVGTFQNLFGTNHAHYGQSDIVSWSNMIGRSVDVTIFTKKYGSLVIAVWDFKKNRLQDAWYNVGGAANTGKSTESANNNANKDSAYLKADLARELDLTYNIDIGNVNWNAGYSATFAGQAIVNSMDDIAYNMIVLNKPGVTQYKANPRYDFAYVMMTFKF